MTVYRCEEERESLHEPEEAMVVGQLRIIADSRTQCIHNVSRNVSLGQ